MRARVRVVGNLTDRAKRYRAQRSAPPGRKICGYCGSRRNVGIDHIDGREEHGDEWNLIYACKSCNTAKGFAFQRAGLGRRTAQFNPADSRPVRTLNQWVLSGLSVCGRSDAMSVQDAAEMIAATSPKRRAAFAEQLANPAKQVPTFEQYLWAVRNHESKQFDEGGAIIHATPKAKRREYARQIAEFKRGRRREEY